MFALRLATHDDVRSVHDFFVRNLYEEEPLVSANGPHDIPHWREGVTRVVIEQGHTVIACETSTGNVIGCALMDEPPQTFCYIYTNDFADIKKLFEHIEKKSGVLDSAPGAVEIRFLAVDKAWRNQGIARALIQTSMDISYQEGFKWAKIYCTSHYSNLLMQKTKWKKLFSLSYKEYASDCDSSIKLPSEPHTHINLYICELTTDNTI